MLNTSTSSSQLFASFDQTEAEDNDGLATAGRHTAIMLLNAP
jgi:hypothetical protein